MSGVNTKKIGDGGEDEAVELILDNGYRLVDRNFRTRFGEIDIIAMDSKTLVFIEVKKKSSDFFGSAGEMITGAKLWKIIKMAKVYLLESNYYGPWRIDAVLIDSVGSKLLKNITSPED
jgi:putative endonuclease